MKILYLTGQLASHGGIERVTIMKLNYLAETDNEIYLSTYEQLGKTFIYPLSGKVKYVDLAVNYNVDYTRESLYSKRCLKLVLQHIKRTHSLLKEIDPDIIVVPNFGYEYWFLPFIKGHSSIIREYHDSQYNVNHASFKSVIDGFVQRFWNKIVVLTPEEKSYFKYRKNIEIIPNPVVLSDFTSDLSAKKIISIGRINRVKGFEKLIEIASLVHKSHPEWTFEIYGDGETEYMNTLKNQVHKEELDNVVKFNGRTSKVYEKLSDSSIYLCTSETESFGLTLVEAMSVGVPVVSFDCPNGPRNIIHNGLDGFLIKNGSITDATNAINQIIENDSMRHGLGEKAKENAARFGIYAVMKKWMILFEKISK